MSVEMKIWRMTDDGPVSVGFSRLDLESRLEDMIVNDPSLVGLDLLIIGRQVATDYGGFIDVLGVDVDGQIHVLELKRHRTPREVVAQTLDYGSWAAELALEDVATRYAEGNEGQEFEDAFADRFSQSLPDVFNADQQLTIVASELDPASDRIVEYLAERFGVPLNAVFFRHFSDGDSEYLARTWLLTPEEAATAQSRTKRRRSGTMRPWNGRDYYVIQGRADDEHNRWAIAEKYGLLNAGGTSWYWKPLRNLKPGHRVFAYVGGAGYVGVGRVEGGMRPAADVTVVVDGVERPLLEAPEVWADYVQRARSGDEDDEMVVPVAWEEVRPVAHAVTETGLFASQVTVCKLRDQRTIDVVTERLGLDGPEAS